MKRILLSAVALVALFFAGRAIYRASVSDETRIRWLLDEMCEGFGATRMAPVTAGLAPEYFEENFGADRELVKAGLAHLFFENRGGDKGFPYRVAWRSEGPTVEPGDEDEGRRATMQLQLDFFERKGEAEERRWVVSVDSELIKRDGEWRFVRTASTTVEGRRLR